MARLKSPRRHTKADTHAMLCTDTAVQYSTVQYSSVQSVVCELWKGPRVLWKRWHYNILTQLCGHLPWRSVCSCPCALVVWTKSARRSVCAWTWLRVLMISTIRKHTVTPRWKQTGHIYVFPFFIIASSLFYPFLHVFYPRVQTFPWCLPSIFCSFLSSFPPPTLDLSCLSHMVCFLYLFRPYLPFFCQLSYSFHSSIHLLIICPERRNDASMETTEERWADDLLWCAYRWATGGGVKVVG